MQDQLQVAIRLTESRIAELEYELKREREFMARLLPPEHQRKKPGPDNRSRWLEVLRAISDSPKKREHIIDYIDEHDLPMTRNATGVWLNEQTKRGRLKRDRAGFYSVTPIGQEWLAASSQASS